VNCPHCDNLLVPYIYEEQSPLLFKLQKQGLIIWGGKEYRIGFPTYFCKRCEIHQYFTHAEIEKLSSKKSYAKKQKRRFAA
jgi:hypothetical protein